MGLLEKFYPRSNGRFARAKPPGWISVQALGLGLLDTDELVRLTVRRFESSSYLDPSYNTDSGFWLWEREALRRFFPPAGRILVGAAGSGREMIALQSSRVQRGRVRMRAILSGSWTDHFARFGLSLDG